MSGLSLSLSFDSEKLSGPNGSYIDFKTAQNRRIHIEHIWTTDSKEKKDHKGIGTIFIRKVVQKAISGGLAFSTMVSGKSSSHIFHLKMGMIPDDYSIHYVPWKYGLEAYSALEAFQTSEPNPAQLAQLKKILEMEERTEDISDEDVFEAKDFLLTLLEKKISFLKDRFIPILLSILKIKSDNLPNSRDLGSMFMHLSERGRIRWERSFKANTPFKPFRHYEHLICYMNTEQKTQLTEILSLEK